MQLKEYVHSKYGMTMGGFNNLPKSFQEIIKQEHTQKGHMQQKDKDSGNPQMSEKVTRTSLEIAGYYGNAYFFGTIGRTDKKRKHVLLENIVYDNENIGNGMNTPMFIRAKPNIADHIWVKLFLFDGKNLCKSNKIHFSADVYRYKRKNGTSDFGLENLSEIKIVEDYKIPAQDFSEDQEIDRLICSTCCQFSKQCYGFTCLMSEDVHVFYQTTLKTKIKAKQEHERGKNEFIALHDSPDQNGKICNN